MLFLKRILSSAGKAWNPTNALVFTRAVPIPKRFNAKIKNHVHEGKITNPIRPVTGLESPPFRNLPLPSQQQILPDHLCQIGPHCRPSGSISFPSPP
jgi:hypothetical protein